MNRGIATALLIGLLFIPGAYAADPRGTVAALAEKPLAVGTQITVLSYDEDTHTYLVTPTKFPGEGEGTITFEALAMAIKSIDLHALTEDPLSVVGKSYKCDAPLHLLSWKG